MRDGFEVSPMKVIGETDKRGTEVHFLHIRPIGRLSPIMGPM